MPVLERKNRPPTHRLQRLVIMLGVLIAVVSLYLSASANGSGKSSGVSRVALSDLPEDPPSYLPWATSVLPIVTPSPYVGIGGAWGAGNIYNTGINAFEYQPPRVKMSWYQHSSKPYVRGGREKMEPLGDQA
jgi:hypothetical protein